MENDGSVVLKTLTTPEISILLKELGNYASINLSEREFKAMIAREDTYKVMLNGASMGIVAITPDNLAKITVWLSDAEPKEKWIEAVKKIISKAFEKPGVFKIKWLIAESRKEMISVAQGCNFKDEGKLLNEGPNMETMIAFGLSGNGNSPKSFFVQSASSEKTNLVDDGLERKMLFLEAKLKEEKEMNERLRNSLLEAEERNKKNNIPASASLRSEAAFKQAVLRIEELEKENEDLQKTLLEVDKKRRIAENDFLLLKEKNEKSGTGEKAAANSLQQENAELMAIIKQLEKQNTELSICVGEKIERIKKQAEIIEEKDNIINELQKKSGIEINPAEIKISNEAGENETAEEKPQQEPEKSEIILQKEEGSDLKTQKENSEEKPRTQQKLKKSISQICATSGLCPAQIEILVEIDKAGGSLNKKTLQAKVGIQPSTFDSYLQYMQDLKVIGIKDKLVSLIV